MSKGKVFIRLPDEPKSILWTAWGDVVSGIPYQYISDGFIVRVVLDDEVDPLGASLRDLIRANRPKPVPDANGDKHCMRLWPLAQCQWVSGHGGGCATP